MKIEDIYTVNIEKMINGGNSFARINNIPVFIEEGCPGDIAKISLTKINKNYLSAKIIEIIKPSVYRVKPECPFHKICGSCGWQHIEYSEQLKQKENIVKETIKQIAGMDLNVEKTIPSPKIKEYRCKIQLPVSQTKNSKRILTGYFKKNTHDLINIKHCIMHPAIINEINEYIKKELQNIGISAYCEKTHKGLLRHIIYRVSSKLDEILVIFVINSNKIISDFYKLSEKITEKYPVIKGVCINFNNKRTNVISGSITKSIKGDDFYTENLSGLKYKISAGSFFQVNPLCAQIIFNTVKEQIHSRVEKPSILDAYSGVSSFGIWMSDISSATVCIEEVSSASSDAAYNAELNNKKNITIINGDAADEFQKLLDKGFRFDVSVTDPPRKGCSNEALNYLIKLTKKYIIYVSCSVSTLARDLKILTENNFIPKFVQPVDMFPNTHHIETIVIFEKSGVEHFR